MIEWGADLEAENDRGYTALQMAMMRETGCGLFENDNDVGRRLCSKTIADDRRS